MRRMQDIVSHNVQRSYYTTPQHTPPHPTCICLVSFLENHRKSGRQIQLCHLACMFDVPFNLPSYPQVSNCFPVLLLDCTAPLHPRLCLLSNLYACLGTCTSSHLIIKGARQCVFYRNNQPTAVVTAIPSSKWRHSTSTRMQVPHCSSHHGPC